MLANANDQGFQVLKFAWSEIGGVGLSFTLCHFCGGVNAMYVHSCNMCLEMKPFQTSLATSNSIF